MSDSHSSGGGQERKHGEGQAVRNRNRNKGDGGNGGGNDKRKQGGRNAKVAPGINPNAPIKIMMNIAKPKEEEPQAVPVAVLAPVQTPVPRSQIKQMGSSASQPSATPTLYVPPPHAQSQHSTPSSYVPLKPSVHPTKEFDKIEQGSKFFSETFMFEGDTFMKTLLDDSQGSHRVIGVIGRQSVGKSTGSYKPPFVEATSNTTLLAQHQTRGVDIHVTPDRLILLDCQPIESASIVTRFMRQEFPLLSDCKSYEQMAQVLDLQLGLFLLSVCHVVLVVDDGFGIQSLAKYFETLQILRWLMPQDLSADLLNPAALASTQPGTSISFSSQYNAYTRTILSKVVRHGTTEQRLLREPSEDDIMKLRKYLDESNTKKSSLVGAGEVNAHATSATDQSFESAAQYGLPFLIDRANDHNPEFIFILNKQSSTNISSSEFTMKTTRILDSLFSSLPMFRSSATHLIRPNFNRDDTWEEGSRANYITLPTYDGIPSKAAGASGYMGPGWAAAARGLQNAILSAPRRPFRKPMVEKEWLRASLRMWDVIRTSPVLQEYNQVLQRTTYAHATSQESSHS